jgi:hypothetical protein|tara:strand:+ start:4835 stop:5536 length:702 start_codon:yes stop_codon:yes gene_type:complete
MSAKKIEKKIVGFKVNKPGEPKPAEEAQATQQDIEQMHENVARPEMLLGSTYKIKTPTSEHAMYITINDIVLNQGTDHEERRPYEVFINSKNMEHFQWVVALTRLISAVFRKGGDATFMVEELKAVFDPRGGYFKKGGVFMPSFVAEIGCAIESHMKMIGLIKEEGLDEHQQALVDEKRAEYEAKAKKSMEASGESESAFPANASQCNKCHQKSVIKMDGCMTCLNCGDSKCG